MQRVLISVGALLILAGLLWPLVSRVLGHLPGDFRVERPGFAFYFPLGSSILVSVILSVVLTLIAWLWHR